MCGAGGQKYGDEFLTVLHLGSGGGSGGNDDSIQNDPLGGRFVKGLLANRLR